MDLIEKIKLVLFQPTKFFENLKKEKGIKESFDYFATLSAFSLVMGVIVSYFFQPVIDAWIYGLFGLPFTPTPMTVWDILAFPLLGYLLGLIFSFAWAGILHAWILLFGGKEDYAKTYQLSIYSATPGLILAWIPFVAFFASIYELVLLIIGTQKIHGIGKTKAILMYVIPAIILILLIIAMIILMAAYYSSGMGMFANYTQ